MATKDAQGATKKGGKRKAAPDADEAGSGGVGGVAGGVHQPPQGAGKRARTKPKRLMSGGASGRKRRRTPRRTSRRHELTMYDQCCRVHSAPRWCFYGARLTVLRIRYSGLWPLARTSLLNATS